MLNSIGDKHAPCGTPSLEWKDGERVGVHSGARMSVRLCELKDEESDGRFEQIWLEPVYPPTSQYLMHMH